MSRPSVAQFISDKRAEGLSDSKITHMLLDAGWHMDIIHKAMHGEPIRQRSLEPILHKKKFYDKKILVYALTAILLIGLAVMAAYL